MMLIKCALDQDGCIDLLAVMRIMNQIDQEQAWALAYQLAALMQRLWPAGNNCATIESLGQIYISQEGFVHEKSLQLAPAAPLAQGRPEEPTRTEAGRFTETLRIGPKSPQIPQDEPDDELKASTRGPAGRHSQQNQQQQQPQHRRHNNQHQELPPTPPITPELHEQLQRRQRASSELELVSSLGIALFWALDYGIPDDEERKLGRTMEFLIMRSQNGLTLGELEQVCIKRLPVATKAQADLHYKSVCKALVADTIELSLLLDKIYTATMVMNGVAPISATQSVQTTTGNNNINNSSSSTNDMSDIKTHHQGDYLPHNHNHNHNHHHHHHHHHQHNHHRHHRHHHLHNQTNYLHHHLLHIDQDDLSELGLPLASLRALKINDWARLWMQVIRELRQRRKFTQHQQYENEHAAELQTV